MSSAVTTGADGRFDRSAARYLARPDYPEALYRLLRRELPRLRDASILDLGCGDGRIGRRLGRWAARVVAVDVSQAMLGRLRASGPGAGAEPMAVRATAARLPFADAVFDHAVVGQAFHWLDAEAATRELLRTVRPGGRLAILWSQPSRPHSRSITASNQVIADVVPDFRPAEAADLTPRSQPPLEFGIHQEMRVIRTIWRLSLAEYVEYVRTRSFVANHLTEAAAPGFAARLRSALNRVGFDRVVTEERDIIVRIGTLGGCQC